MTHYTVSYAGLTNKARDDKAIQDTKDYLGDRFSIIEEALQDSERSLASCETLMGFAGVSGTPVHALLRRYRLAEFRAWMADDTLEGSIQTDEEGFPL